MPAGAPRSSDMPPEELARQLRDCLTQAACDGRLMQRKSLATEVAKLVEKKEGGIREGRSFKQLVGYLERMIANRALSGIGTSQGRYAYCYIIDNAGLFDDLAERQHPQTQSNAFCFLDDQEKGVTEFFLTAHFALWFALQGYDVVIDQDRKRKGRLRNPDAAAWSSVEQDFLILVDAKDTDTDWAKEITGVCGYKRFANLSFIGFALDKTIALTTEVKLGPWTCWEQTLNMCDLARATGVGLLILECPRLARSTLESWHKAIKHGLEEGTEAVTIATQDNIVPDQKAWVQQFSVHKIVDPEQDDPPLSLIRRFLSERDWLNAREATPEY